MAGESPDRSKQRESSAEPTSGSAGPVPGARSESADPRLAMAREARKSSGRVSVDTATRVLSTRTAEERTAEERGDAERGANDAVSEESAESGKPGKSGESGEPGKSGEASGGDSGERGAGRSGGSDGRLREAVAAWVASADDEKQSGEGTNSGTDPGTDSREAERADGADETAPRGQEAADPADRAADAQEAAEAASQGSQGSQGQDEAEEPGADRSAAAGDSARTGKAEPAGSADGEADSTTGGTSASAAADSADGTPAGTAASRTSGDDAETAAAAPEPDSDTTEGTDAGNAASGDGASGTDGESRPDTATKPAPTGTGRDTAQGTDEDASQADGDSRPSTDTKPAPTATGTDEDADDSDAPEADGESRPDTDTTEPAPTGTGKDPVSKSGTGKAPASGADKAGDGKTGDGTARGGASGGVDQPTAVFKAVRPPVDQPTTMLKLGGGTKDADAEADADADGKADAPEKDAERTSKFVALKPLDDPAARKPVQPADATAPVPAVGPAVGPERTTQQPLPPKPPLDLLAELTNTPPPPETPLRTAVRRVKIWTPLVLLLVIVFAVVQSVRPLPTPTLDLTAKDSYTFEGGQVDIPWPAKGQAALDVQGIGTFGSSGEQKPVPIASVAKVMTAYVILRDHPLKSGAEGPKINIDQAAEDQSDAGQESTVDVTKGDKITQREALESILIASANNVARLLARWDAGSEKAFVQKMNDAAEDLGMKNTTYTDPSGLNNTTVSTAVDQVKLAKAAMQQPAFREVAAMMSYVDYKGTRHDNWNRLVGSNDVTGIKTGTTTSALGNLVFSAKKDVNGETHRIIGAVVRQPAGGPDNTILGAALYEGDRLIRAAQGALETATILKKGTVVGYADDGLGGRTPVAVTEDVTAVGWAGLSVKLTFAADDLPHTAKAGTKVGTLTVGDGSSGAVKVPVALQEDLVEPGFAAKLTRIA
ncbi:D-alanyl-D-alanine carboxypeptidase [Streptomyces sp. NPDC093516]|uniref:D-alanyl-D-alanine carboxypeptidase n=1 Tax=Streptomyces sp. NPDC093516 TaxID=3155304 RepID=UPI00342C1229